MVKSYLADTNVIIRWADHHDSEHLVAVQAVTNLLRRGDRLWITAQNLVEFWNVATRPAARNGFGMSHREANLQIEAFRGPFDFAADVPEIFPEWLALVTSLGVSGVKVHDARLAAVMRVYGLTHILTFNIADFRRFPGITPVHPQDVQS